jgi:hypothetical protein
MADSIEEALELLWGTYGKGGLAEHAAFGTPLPEMLVKRLGDLDTDHLEKILETQEQLEDHYREAINLILKTRAEVNDERLKIRRRDAVEATREKTKCYTS